VSLLLELLSGICLLAGTVLCITAGVGLLRMPDFFSRVHAAGVIESLAAPLLLVGLMLQMEWSLDLVKVLFILLFILMTSPNAGQAMARAALHGGLRPLVADEADSSAGHREGEGEPPSKP
jgi:multicomponent Na+:H+ antiporter subunit G